MMQVAVHLDCNQASAGATWDISYTGGLYTRSGDRGGQGTRP